MVEVYQGRNLNFDENKKLRDAYLNSTERSIDFGNKLQDVLKSLPTMTAAGAGGGLLAFIAQFTGIRNIPQIDILSCILILGSAAIGFLINSKYVKWKSKKTQKEYVAQDHERNLYYKHYVRRVELILKALYKDLDRIHNEVFDHSYPIKGEADSIIEDLIKGIWPTYCKYASKHIQEKRITPELWPMCEIGDEDYICEHCREFKRESS